MTLRPCTVGVNLLVLSFVGVTYADPGRYALVVGHNLGRSDEAPLRYAERDARRVHQLLTEVGGVAPENAVLLQGPSAETLRAALIRLNDRVRNERTRPGVDDLLLVYYSGHADARALHLGREELPLASLEQLVRGSAARLRLLLLDACRSGALTRAKGARHAPPFRVSVERSSTANGVMFFSASAADEEAYESDKLQGSFFTHYWVSALRGAADANGDAAVTVDEAYSYAFEQTLRASSATLGGPQHATYRYDLRGQGDVVLARLRQHTHLALLTFPRERTYWLFRGRAAGPLVAEVVTQTRPARLVVRPGRYFVRGRAPDYLLEGTITAEPGTTRPIVERQLARVDYARLARKGGGPVSWVHGPELAYRLRTPIVDGDSLCHGAALGYRVDLQHLSLTPRLGLCGSSFANEVLSASSLELDAQGRVSHAFDLPLVSVELGASAGFSVFHQRFETRGSAPARWPLGGYFGLDLALGVQLPRGYYVSAGAELLSYIIAPEEESGLDARLAARAICALGKALGPGTK